MSHVLTMSPQDKLPEKMRKEGKGRGGHKPSCRAPLGLSEAEMGLRDRGVVSWPFSKNVLAAQHGELWVGPGGWLESQSLTHWVCPLRPVPGG